MLESKLLEELEEAQVFSKRHVVLREGLHSDMFVDIEKLFQNNVPLVNSLCCMMAEDVNKKSIPVDMVMGPAEGGKLVAKRVAYTLHVITYFYKINMKEGFPFFRRVHW